MKATTCALVGGLACASAFAPVSSFAGSSVAVRAPAARAVKGECSCSKLAPATLQNWAAAGAYYI
eukprot:2060-Heterococcus_DN1.PRE.3